MRSSRDHDRDRLQEQLQAPEYQNLLRVLKRHSPFLRRFQSWGEVVAFMREGTSQDPRKDEVLRPIFAAHAAGQDPLWRTVLLVIFWPGLESIHYQKRDWEPDQEERWQDIIWTFFQILCRIDVEQRPSRLVQKVFNDTVHHLHDEYRRNWDRASIEVSAETEELVSAAAGPNTEPLVMFLQREEQETEIRRLREHLKAGRINEVDFHLIVGSRLYGKKIPDLARELGIAYQAAKKRRQRAEDAIRRFYEVIEKS